MTSLLKNQIVKHLSKFVKNLNSDQISVSTLKGEGDLRNIELNEQVLTELLELPNWLRLTSAKCNHVSARIHWTRLKTVPIVLSLDEVFVSVQTCDQHVVAPTKSSGGSPPSAPAGQTSYSRHYGFAEKVLDGVLLNVNSVVLQLSSRAFSASIEISRIIVESKSPAYQRVSDLKLTRVKDTKRNEVITFKEISWQTLRIEAMTVATQTELTPLRLITNNTVCRLTLKKGISDCAVIACRLMFILDDIVWVLTDSQVKAMLHFADSLSDLIKRATEETQQKKAARKLQTLSRTQSGRQASSSHPATDENRAFAKWDIVETSYHVYVERIDLHLCDDSATGLSCHPELAGECSNLQLSIGGMQIDLYPFHAGSANIGSRNAWLNYGGQPGSTGATKYLTGELVNFYEWLTRTLTGSSQHKPVRRTSRLDIASSQTPPSTRYQSPVGVSICSQFKRMMSSTFVVRLNSLAVWKLKNHLMSVRRQLIFGDPKRCAANSSDPLFHVEFSQFFYPNCVDFPIPPPKLYVYANALTFDPDRLTLVWLNAFALEMERAVKKLALANLSPNRDSSRSASSLNSTSINDNPSYVDIKVDLVNMLINVSPEKVSSQIKHPDRPEVLAINIRRCVFANFRSYLAKQAFNSKTSLQSILRCVTDPLSSAPSDLANLEAHTNGYDNEDRWARLTAVVADVNETQSINPAAKIKDLMWLDNRDTWSVHVDCIQTQFVMPTEGTTIPLATMCSLDLWLNQSREPSSDRLTISVAAELTSTVADNMQLALQLDRQKLIFLLRIADWASETAFVVSRDGELQCQPATVVHCVVSVRPEIVLDLIMVHTGVHLMALKSKKFDSGESQKTNPISGSKEAHSSKSEALSESTVVDMEYAFEAVEPTDRINTNQSGFHCYVPSANPETLETPSISSSPSSSSSSSSTAVSMTDSYESVQPECDNGGVAGVGPHTPSLVSMASMLAINSGCVDDSTSSSGFDSATTLSTVPDCVIDDSIAKLSTVCLATAKVNVIRIRLLRSTFNQHSDKTQKTSLRIIAVGLAVSEMADLSWLEYQSQFRLENDPSGRLDAGLARSIAESELPQFSLHFQSSPPAFDDVMCQLEADRKSSLRSLIADMSGAEISININCLPLDLSTMAVEALADFVQDERIPPPIPIQLTLTNISLRLNETRTDRHDADSTFPLHVPPVLLSVPKLILTRSASDGKFTVSASGSSRCSNCSNDIDDKRQQTVIDEQLQLLTVANLEIRRQCDATRVTFEKANRRLIQAEQQWNESALKERQLLDLARDENEALRRTLAMAQDQLVALRLSQGG